MERRAGLKFADMAKKVAADVAKDDKVLKNDGGKVNTMFEDSCILSNEHKTESPCFQGFRRMDSYVSFKRPNGVSETDLVDYKPKRKQASSRLKVRRNTLRASLKVKLRKIIEERLTIRQIFQRYVEDSTLHGFRYTCSDTYFIRRFIWSVLMILGAVYFLWKLKEGVVEFLDYPFSSLFMVTYTEELNFPAISICPLNSYKLDALENSPLKRLYDRLPLDKDWREPGFDVPGDEFVRNLFNISYKIEDIFEDCDWIKRDTNHPSVLPNQCGTNNFTSFFNNKGQLCYTLNSGKTGHPALQVKHAGLNYGYEILMDLNIMNALKSFPYAGVRIIIHHQDEPPVMEEGFSLSPGFKTFVKLNRIETTNLPPPFDTQCGDTELKYFDAYNQKACLLELLTDYTGEICECREPFMPDNGKPYCSLRQSITCMLPAKESFDEYKMRQKCPVDCEAVSFDVKLSDSRYLHDPPKGVELVLLQQQALWKGKNETHLMQLAKKYTSEELDKYIESNVMNVIFFYGDMRKDLLEQEATFDFYQFLGDMGGEIGLMLGASLLTFVEFMDLIIVLIYHQLLRLNKKKKEKEQLNERGYEATEEEEELKSNGVKNL